MVHKSMAVVVLYHPESTITAKLKRLQQFLQVVVVDNTPDSIYEQFIPPDIHILSKGVNGGTGYAYNLAADYAMRNKIPYLLLLDQDSDYPVEQLHQFESLLDTIPECAVVSPLHINQYDKPILNDNWEKIPSVMASGNLIRLDAWQKVGGFNADLFLDYVDIDYCFRLRRKKYFVYRSGNITMEHHEGTVQLVSFFGKKVRTYHYPPLRWYYRAKNLLKLKMEFGAEFPELLNIETTKFRRDVIKMLLYEKNKLEKIRAVIKGRRDFRDRTIKTS